MKILKENWQILVLVGLGIFFYGHVSDWTFGIERLKQAPRYLSWSNFLIYLGAALKIIFKVLLAGFVIYGCAWIISKIRKK